MGDMDDWGSTILVKVQDTKNYKSDRLRLGLQSLGLAQKDSLLRLVI
jgi:hypothetical protein